MLLRTGIAESRETTTTGRGFSEGSSINQMSPRLNSARLRPDDSEEVLFRSVSPAR